MGYASIDQSMWGGWHIMKGGSFEPQRSHHFTLYVNDFRALMQASMLSGFLPEESSAILTYLDVNRNKKVAGNAEFAAGQITLVDYIDQGAAKTLASWRREVYNATTDTVGYPINYKKEATVQMLTVSGGVSQSWRLVGCWPSSVKYSQGLDYNSPGVNKITITLEYDYAYMEGAGAKFNNGNSEVGSSSPAEAAQPLPSQTIETVAASESSDEGNKADKVQKNAEKNGGPILYQRSGSFQRDPFKEGDFGDLSEYSGYDDINPYSTTYTDEELNNR